MLPSEKISAATDSSTALCDLGIALWKQGDVHQAGVVERESLPLSRSFNQKLGIGMSIEVLAWIAVADGAYKRAPRLFQALQEIWSAIGVPPSGLRHIAAYHGQCVAELAANHLPRHLPSLHAKSSESRVASTPIACQGAVSECQESRTVVQ